VQNEDQAFDLELLPNDIKVMTGLEGIRLRPRMYIKDFEQEDTCDRLVFETLCHAIDEFVDGHCRYLDILVLPSEVTISYDAGVSLEKIHGETHAETILTALFACSHTKKHSEIGQTYCGIGMVVVNALSKEFQFKTIWNGLKGEVTYQKGVRIGEFSITPCKEPNQTVFQFTPDLEILGKRCFHIANIAAQAQTLRDDFPGFHVTVREL
jgi:DNA gyrase/topoisomerase IV subunit B